MANFEGQVLPRITHLRALDVDEDRSRWDDATYSLNLIAKGVSGQV